MKILVTGASGYIGLHVVRELLSRGSKVTAITRDPELFGHLRAFTDLVIVKSDLEDRSWYEEVINGHDCCIHAALVWGDEAKETEGYDASITASFFDAAGRANVKRAIYISSTAVHRGAEGVISERHALTSRDLYGVTKAAGEMFFRSACERHKVSGVVVRPGPVVGKPAFEGGDVPVHRLLEQLLSDALEGRELSVQKGKVMQFCDVYFLARMLAEVAASSDPEDAYFCVSEQPLLLSEIAKVICEVVGSQSRIVERDEANASVCFDTSLMQSLSTEVHCVKKSLLEYVTILLNRHQQNR